MAIMTASIGAELRDALGLPPGIVSIDLKFKSGDIVRATVEYAPTREQLDKVVSILRRYELHEKSMEEIPVEREQTTEERQ